MLGLPQLSTIRCAESPIKYSMRGLTFRSLLISCSVTVAPGARHDVRSRRSGVKVAQGASGRKTMGFVPLGTCVRENITTVLIMCIGMWLAVFAIAKSNRNNSKKVLGTRKEPAEIHLCVVRPVGEAEKYEDRNYRSWKSWRRSGKIMG